MLCEAALSQPDREFTHLDMTPTVTARNSCVMSSKLGSDPEECRDYEACLWYAAHVAHQLS